ncbi:MAG: polyprenyl synthetase family protein [Myxococcales bacterium]|nr:polyprenyl synthetase family protein [Myxococcales bacterium]MCB9530938.1 polyprenyl synthetase family protein [Myxococcales bacterium]
MTSNAGVPDTVLDEARQDDELRAALAPLRALVDAQIDAVCDAIVAPAPLPEAMRYAVAGGGKRLRPIMVLAAHDAAMHDRRGVGRERAAQLGVALEFVHAYSLVHDDLPAMDDDTMRRGMPTVHVAYGEAVAILVGDALLTEAFRVAADALAPRPELAVRAVLELARAAGADGMVGGQVLDILADKAAVRPTPDATLAMHAKKTGALFVAACRLGAIAADASAEATEALGEFGTELGAAFQMSDDLLDALAGGADDGHEHAVNLTASLGARAVIERTYRATDAAARQLQRLPGDVEALDRVAAWVRGRASDVERTLQP